MLQPMGSQAIRRKTTDRRVLQGILAGVPALGYLLYLTGRAYSAAYYSTLGVPDLLLNFGFWDHIYFGTEGVRFLIPLAFAAMFVGLVLYLTESSPWYYDDPLPRWQYGLVVIYFVFYAAMLPAFIAYTWLISPALRSEAAYSFTAVMVAVLAAGWSLMVLWDKKMIAGVRDGRIMSRLFPWLIAVVLIFFPHTLADAAGKVAGFMAQDSHPLVELYAQQQVVDGISWEPTGADSYRTVDDLYLLFSTQQYLIVQQASDRIGSYVIPVDSILFIKIVGPGRGAR